MLARLSRRVPILTALGAVFISGRVLAACGSGVPGNAVARVDDMSITRSDFLHWLRVAAASSASTVPGQPPTNVIAPDPPNFTGCIAAKRRTAPKPAKGQPTPTDRDFKAQCEQEYMSLRDQVMSFLISSDWIMGEAADQGIKASSAEVQRRLAQIKQQQFPKPGDFNKFLTSSGMNLTDIYYRTKLIVFSDKLRAKIIKGKGTVTPAQIARYYQQNRSRYAQPERRDLRIILTKTQPQAQKAKRALVNGQSFKNVAKKFSIDQATKNQGGALLGVARGQQEKALDDAVFSAKVGVLTGPVKTTFGYYVFRVEKVIPASQQSQAQATPEIRALLSQMSQQGALTTFISHYQAKWKSRTNCRSGYVVQTCSNYHAPKTPSIPGVPGAPGAPGGAPSQTPPPRVGGATTG
jgi:foldase protein PrsA